jgi:hypothetical protein
MTRKNAPIRLGVSGRRLWREMQQMFTFDPSETAPLLQLCCNLDELDRLERELAEQPATVVRGSRGQPVAHPLLAEIRAHRLVSVKLQRALDLPDIRKPQARRGRLSSPIQAVRNGA